MQDLLSFTKFYIKSMRLHFGFITGIAGWIGIAYYEYLYPETQVDLAKKIFFLIAIFLAYGVNQVVNDYFGMEEDRINAPNRPMVTGELSPKIALFTSFSIMIILGIVSWFIAPLSVLPLIAGVLLNLLYEYAKSISLLGNVIFGMSMTVCPIYGFTIAGPVGPLTLSWQIIGLLALMVFITGRMTYFTYFKDYEGDKATGTKTFIVVHGLDTARKVGLIFSFIPGVIVLSLLALGAIDLATFQDPTAALFCFSLTVLTVLWTGILYYIKPSGEATYYNLRINIQACVLSLITILSIIDGTLALYLLSASYILIDMIFGLHGDAKA
ncbi:MAG: hypothetical protein A2504_03290 [Bdellovibrionales bacterium RIFOXYD12_FULL_39_22]|nr:MAG: hypothetical protein A2385_15700 [Bdellovibrionales bacterium RIFOXYB1_FULL_39_21]OFZ41549.1 MAG: hypothetical protein A2485_02390 [Bdellovibrionales bacterium RIFOXYC12_FULL_39_17]OFZ45862.1 MAG: hypothetical protein A2404_12755 [Bdellovibrionales bacterium RIFOXYC1_FULL_39_130]OFZ73547.1 MAG: hypothetical protein A2451_01155 [Bdellovibrionales bacterium RIFOXYC2_FULL_39_8]OFZ74794.1 MAG: hypothetical protein A2560_10185 [Bdellovibrionales bacterium RIFOXYD1_FULL_39_84]OFZ92654.1 MAG: